MTAFPGLQVPLFDGAPASWCLVVCLWAVAGSILFAGWSRLDLSITGSGLFALAAVCLWVAPALAQDSGQDLQALLAKAQARADQEAKDIAVWAQSLGHRADSQTGTAASIEAANPRRIAQGAALMDDPAWRAIGQPVQTPASAGGIYVAVSLSMPPQALRDLARDAHRAGARLVIRGLIDNSFKATLARIREVFNDQSLGGVAIDPRVFQAFAVSAVPTVIAAGAPVQPCGALGCTPAAPVFDKISGNISLESALKSLAEDGEGGAAAARAALDLLTG
jgi:conjugal transfer pilus assembly protein TrbC